MVGVCGQGGGADAHTAVRGSRPGGETTSTHSHRINTGLIGDGPAACLPNVRAILAHRWHHIAPSTFANDANVMTHPKPLAVRVLHVLAVILSLKVVIFVAEVVMCVDVQHGLPVCEVAAPAPLVE